MTAPLHAPFLSPTTNGSGRQRWLGGLCDLPSQRRGWLGFKATHKLSLRQPHIQTTISRVISTNLAYPPGSFYDENFCGSQFVTASNGSCSEEGIQNQISRGTACQHHSCICRGRGIWLIGSTLSAHHRFLAHQLKLIMGRHWTWLWPAGSQKRKLPFMPRWES